MAENMNLTKKEHGFHYGWIILGMSVLVVFSSLGLARFGYTMLLPPMQDGLGLSNVETGGLATGNFLGYLALALIGGFLASHFSPKRVITFSLLVVGITMIATGTSRGFYTAFLWRTLTGMGSGGSNVPVMALLAAWFAPRRRGFAAGIGVAGSSIGLIITGAFVPMILNSFGEKGWRYGWFILGTLALLFAVLSWLILRDRPQECGLYPLGEKASSDSETPPPKHPEGRKSWFLVYKSPIVWRLALIYITFGFSYIIYCTFFAKYLQDEMGYTQESAGNLWQIVGWISILCGLVWGWFSDVAGRKYGLALVSFLQGTSYLLFAVWKTPVGLTFSAVLFGITAWSIPAIMAATCGDRLGPRMAPAALGFITLFFGIAQALGPTVAGVIADVKGSFVPAFILAMAVAWCGAVASLFLKRKTAIH